MTTINNALEAARAGVGAPVYQELLARLDLYSESIVMTRYGQDGQPATAYELAPRDLAQAFSGMTLATGLLPVDCLFVTRHSGHEQVGVYIPPARQTLHLAGETVEIPLPGLIFVARGGADYAVWAVKARPSEPSERLFRAPLPNVYPDGKICPGNVAFPVGGVRTIRQAVKLFFGSEFNGDLAHGKSQKYDGDIRQMWAEVAGLDEYPLADLMPTPEKLADVMGAEQ